MITLLLLLISLNSIRGCYVTGFGTGLFGLPFVNTGLINTVPTLGGTTGIIGGTGTGGTGTIPIVPDDPSVFQTQARAQFRSPQLQQAVTAAVNNPQLQQILTNLLNNNRLRSIIEQLLANPQLQQRIVQLASDPRLTQLVNQVLSNMTPQVLQTLAALRQATSGLLPNGLAPVVNPPTSDVASGLLPNGLEPVIPEPTALLQTDSNDLLQTESKGSIQAVDPAAEPNKVDTAEAASDVADEIKPKTTASPYHYIAPAQNVQTQQQLLLQQQNLLQQRNQFNPRFLRRFRK